MRLAVVSHKVCWPSATSPSGYATDGGFPMQMRAISQLFDATTLVVPCESGGQRAGEVPLDGHGLTVAPLESIAGADMARKLRLPAWLARNLPRLVREIRRADAVHTPIPGDVGTLGMLLAWALGKPLFVRHCGNWLVQRTVAEHAWRWMLERTAGRRTVVLTTGGAAEPPSRRNPNLRWIFSTSLTEIELAELRTERAAPVGAPRLAIVCRQEHLKGTGVVIDALARLSGDWPEAQLDVVGDGGALPEFRARAETLGLTNRVTFHGKLNHAGVVRVLRSADLFCYPTAASEGFPKVVLEAMACGLPVVTTPVSVLGDLCRSGGGVLIDRPDADALARVVRWCVAEPARFRALSDAAMETARAYSLERWRDTIGELLTTNWGPLRSQSHA